MPVSIVFEVRQQRLGKNMFTKLEVNELFLPWTAAQSSNKCTTCSSGQRDCPSGHISVHTSGPKGCFIQSIDYLVFLHSGKQKSVRPVKRATEILFREVFYL